MSNRQLPQWYDFLSLIRTLVVGVTFGKSASSSCSSVEKTTFALLTTASQFKHADKALVNPFLSDVGDLQISSFSHSPSSANRYDLATHVNIEEEVVDLGPSRNSVPTLHTRPWPRTMPIHALLVSPPPVLKAQPHFQLGIYRAPSSLVSQCKRSQSLDHRAHLLHSSAFYVLRHNKCHFLKRPCQSFAD